MSVLVDPAYYVWCKEVGDEKPAKKYSHKEKYRQRLAAMLMEKEQEVVTSDYPPYQELNLSALPQELTFK